MSRTVPAAMTAAWKSQGKIGAQRPVVRAIIQRQHMRSFEYDTAWAQGGTFEAERHRSAHFRSFLFGEDSPYREIPNIKTCNWDRSVGQDAATCTITLLNAAMQPLGTVAADDVDELDNPGFLTFSRGSSTISRGRWGYAKNGWAGIFVPDMVVKTYEGYGIDPSKTPMTDPHLMQSGTWLIDKVTYGADGSIQLEMRDLARLLLDQMVFPPAVPYAEYPLSWSRVRSENVVSRDATGGSWVDRLRRFGKARSSNEKYIGKGLTNAPYAHYVSAGGNVDGFRVINPITSHPLDTDAQKEHDLSIAWRSTGQDSPNSFVWWEYDHSGGTMPVAGIRLRMSGGPYRVYVSIHDGTKWRGKRKIHWKQNGITGSPGNVDIGADIPFVKSAIADRGFPFDIILPRKYHAQKIRITITHLRHTGVGEHPYRAGIKEMKLYTGNYGSLGFKRGEKLKVVGNYGDYTWIVKWVCAWAGWYWPGHGTGKDYIRVQSGTGTATKDWVSYDYPDPALPKGRVWGDFMKSGTVGQADLTVDMFDKKPLMDVIGYVRDLLGFLFFIDEAGGVVWRMPNLWDLGNYLSPEDYADGRPGRRTRLGRTSEIVTLDENETLLNYSTILDSTNVRERIFIGNAVGGVGSVIKGFNPYPVGLMRTAGWTDQNFTTKRETRIMADMIAARAKFAYRTGQATIPGYPKIQIDDQVRIFERLTNETAYHYVTGIKSELDMSTGVWTYDLNTHWLGEDPATEGLNAWVVRNKQLADETQKYLKAVGYTPVDAEDKGN